MLNEIETLRILQDRDQSISQLEEELKSLPIERQRILDGLKNDENREAAAKAEVQKVEVEVKNLELKIATRRDTIGKLQKQQFETKKNEEYAALGSEIDRYHSEVDELETEELMALERVDAAKLTLAEARKKLEATREVINGRLDELETKHKACQARKEELTKKRSECSDKIEDALLTLYERLRKRRGDQVVAGLSAAGQCGACHMKVTHTTLSATNAQKEITQCEHCGAILFPA